MSVAFLTNARLKRQRLKNYVDKQTNATMQMDQNKKNKKILN
jgi:hypothetical protein